MSETTGPTWQPIDSAPKDATCLLLYALEWNCHSYATGYYGKFSDGSEGWIASTFLTVPAFDDGHEWWGSLVHPTHWAPMLTPPAAEGQG